MIRCAAVRRLRRPDQSSLTDNRLSLGGYMLLANTKLGAGWLRRDNGGSPTKSDLLYAGASYDITPPSTAGGSTG